ncbi:glycoside hydrolase family 113 [Neotamlana laminarinivorans]|uniref:Glycoside hydrolase TIM-barrel-like domain-containing protein n=1 Tax=Neotamlana laminarinivorans TaxID=2883124 RepID=A0A9X1I364_9FLAO|nr:glycoside hydrolase TIM-barrel-like domain-containing protein [Tamlana laminarinivorans]MCB4799149.1 glycoside hydrolase TIM-barrel-like domain-containing protein [Tamlana laminarinivorans]
MQYLKCKFLGVILLILTACNGQVEKINGVSFVASRDNINATHVKPVVNVNANYAAIMPFGFVEHLEHPSIKHNTERQWFGEKRAGAKQYIEQLRKAKIKIMVKPQIWVRRGEFTGEIKMTSEASWKELEAAYSNFILEYAALAQEVEAEILCIGTELQKFIEHRPEYWVQLINEIKKVYSGKLTYAANWDEYKTTPFWDKLDFIGIDAYFPVSDMQTPTVEACIQGWKAHKSTIKSISEKHNKPILFTEFGYRSVDFSGKKPWVFSRSMTKVNLEAQVNTTKALFETFWRENWFAGGFVWKWFHKHNEVGGINNSQFTPQNKPAEAVIKHYYNTIK